MNVHVHPTLWTVEYLPLGKYTRVYYKTKISWILKKNNFSGKFLQTDRSDQTFSGTADWYASECIQHFNESGVTCWLLFCEYHMYPNIQNQRKAKLFFSSGQKSQAASKTTFRHFQERQREGQICDNNWRWQGQRESSRLRQHTNRPRRRRRHEGAEGHCLS